KNIDTGMGLERMVCIIQEGKTNFDTDLFLPIIREIERISGKTYDPDGDNMSFKVIADHIRALSFAIGDGALPGNEGRGYVLRRLLRRAVMHGKKLGIEGKFLAQLVPIVGQIMESYYPEVLEKQDFIMQIIDREEEAFGRTIDEGSKLLDELLAKLKEEGKTTLEGQDIFRLYDTYGFPVELTEELAEDAGFKIDHEGFKAAMKKQQDRARAAAVKGGSMGAQNETLQSIKEESEFLYDVEKYDAKLLVAVKDDEKVNTASGEAQLIFDKTPFYAEM
ncbi:MAG TPA: alanine--tRNA ligase, partial [Lactococcus sp.]|nr:alanine--tRNA ligase [Lactococcus sp.]